LASTLLFERCTETWNPKKTFGETKALEWTGEDNIVVEIGGTQVSGIDVGDNYNPKWSSPKGTRKYNKDAFIVIKNLSRTPFKSSEPNPELKARHA
jgi:hypothetical protein